MAVHTTEIREIRRVIPEPEMVVGERARCACGWAGPERRPGSGDADMDASDHRRVASEVGAGTW